MRTLPPSPSARAARCAALLTACQLLGARCAIARADRCTSVRAARAHCWHTDAQPRTRMSAAALMMIALFALLIALTIPLVIALMIVLMIVRMIGGRMSAAAAARRPRVSGRRPSRSSVG
eukprot:5640687-Prymnesium_polylepis.1